MNMNSRKKRFAAILLAGITFICTSGITHVQVKADPVQEENVEEKIQQMSLAEKIAQLFFITPETLAGNAVSAGDTTRGAYEAYPVGGIILMSANIESYDQVKNLIAGYQQMSQETGGVPIFVGVDEEGGIVSRIAKSGIMETPVYDSMQAIGQTGDSLKAYETGCQIGSYLSELGFNVDFAPVADVLTNPQNTVIGSRSFGSDPSIDGAMVASEVKGLHTKGMLSTLKHFPGHGDTYEDSHEGKSYVYKTREELENCEWIPFKKGIEAGSDFVMMGHISCPGITGDDTPASLSYTICTEILRDQLGFQGLVITDAMNMGAVANEYASGDAAVRAVQAGADMILMPADFSAAYAGVRNAVQNGTRTEERINESVRRILAVKNKINTAE